MRETLCAIAALAMIGLGDPSAGAQATQLYRDRTGGREIRILISYLPLPVGLVVQSRMSDGERHDVQIDSSAATTTYHVEMPPRRLSYTVTRSGNVLKMEGVLGGSPLSRSIPIDEHPWYQAMETSLHDFAVSGRSRPLVFWIVQPWEANAYLMQARAEGQEGITVNDARVTALRVRVRPAGLLSFLWSSLYWFRVSDGRFVRYEAVRGFPGTPKTVVEYMGDG